MNVDPHCRAAALHKRSQLSMNEFVTAQCDSTLSSHFVEPCFSTIRYITNGIMLQLQLYYSETARRTDFMHCPQFPRHQRLLILTG